MNEFDIGNYRRYLLQSFVNKGKRRRKHEQEQEQKQSKVPQQPKGSLRFNLGIGLVMATSVISVGALYSLVESNNSQASGDDSVTIESRKLELVAVTCHKQKRTMYEDEVAFSALIRNRGLELGPDILTSTITSVDRLQSLLLYNYQGSQTIPKVITVQARFPMNHNSLVPKDSEVFSYAISEGAVYPLGQSQLAIADSPAVRAKLSISVRCP